MADVAVSALVIEVLGRLTPAAIQQFRLLRGLEDDVLALRVSFREIQAVLEDAEVKQREQKAVERWLRRLKSASSKVENVLDEVSTETMLRRLHNERGIKYRVRAFFSLDHNWLMVRIRIAHKVKNIRRKLDAIAANRSNFDLTPGSIIADAGVGGDTRSRETSSLIDLSEIYGRDAEMEMVTQKICNRDTVGQDIDDVQVYAIWGMGGVGKTTLAQLVYNNERVKTRFELKSWVYVSNEFEAKKLTKAIIESIDGHPCTLSQLDTMQVDLQNKLRGKRFLIVLDDVWNDDRIKWDELSKALSCGAEGSIVMITTRSQETSRMMAKFPDFQHEVGCLSEEDSWSLFKKLAFGAGREGENITELEPIGKEIVEKCKGLPLAVKTLGSLMWSKSSAIEWQRVKESNIWELQENDVYILPALELSYNNLSPHLKRCFAYCCLFPKGYEMNKVLLIELWMANGFIPSTREADIYALGEEIFNCLVRRSFFQDVQEETFFQDVQEGKSMDRICKMHDLMHDLAQYVMRHDCSVIEPGKLLITPDEVLHLSSSCPDFLLSDQDSEKLRPLRSIFIFTHEYKGRISQIFEHRYLRVLHLIGTGRTTLPESICKLKYLRYLNMSGSDIEVLPESIIYLQNLQVLLLQSCMELKNLPEGMRYMRNLRCLDIRNCNALQCMPVGMKELAGLWRLSNFIVGKNNGTTIGELGDLNLLGWELELLGLENVGGLGDAKSANLNCKKELISLVLCWNNYDGSSRGIKYDRPDSLLHERDEMVLEGLEPNSSLKELEIRYYMGKKISPRWMANLGNLAKIRFWDCQSCECIPPLGKLPSLRVIDILGMHSLKCFHDDDYATSGDDILFPCLQELNIRWCSNLVSLPSNLPKLRELGIHHCRRLDSLPDGLQSLKELTRLRISGCENLRRRYEKEIGEDWAKISRIPYIDLC